MRFGLHRVSLTVLFAFPTTNIRTIRFNAATSMLAPIGLLLAFCLSGNAQIMDAAGAHAVPRPDIGHDYIHLLNETVSPAEGSVNISIDIPLPPGRGLTLPFSLSYNSGSVFTYNDSGQGNVELDEDTGVTGRSRAGWEYTTPQLTYSLNHSVYDNSMYPNLLTGHIDCYWTTNYMFSSPSGSRHPLGLAGAISFAQGNPSPNAGEALNGLCPSTYTYTSGGDFKTVAHLCWTYSIDHCTRPHVATTDGTVYSFDIDEGSNVTFATSVVDRNQNKILINKTGYTTTYTDELGRTALTLNAKMGVDLSNTVNVSTDTIAVPQYPRPYSVQWGKQASSGASGHVQVLGAQGTDFCGTASRPITGGFAVGPVEVVNTITLPNETQYQLSYDPVFGLLKRITYPNGGYVEYDWTMQPYFHHNTFSIALSNGPGGVLYDPSTDGAPLPYYVKCSYAYDWPAITARRVSFDGNTVAQTQVFSYSATPTTLSGLTRTTTVSTTDNVTGQTSRTVYNYNIVPSQSNDPLNFVPAYGQLLEEATSGQVIATIPSTYPVLIPENPLESSILYEDGSGNPLKTVSKTWIDYTSDMENSETVTLGPNGPSSTTAYQYAWPGQTTQTAVTDYDGSQRVTNIAYHAFCPLSVFQTNNGPGDCLEAGEAIFDRPDSVVRTTSTVANTPAAAETDYSNYDSHGNARTVTAKCWQGAQLCPDSVTSYVFDANGQVTSRTDALGNVTTFDYTDNFTTGSPANATNAYLTKVTYPRINNIDHIERYDYDYLSGHLNHMIDENGQTTGYVYNDPVGRLTEVDYPDRGKTTAQYNDSGTPTVTRSQLDGPTTVSVYDGMYHVVQTQVLDGSKTVYTDARYNGNGQLYTASNPYYTRADSTYGVTTNLYDELGRLSSVTKQDGNQAKWTYSGKTTTETDEVNNSWTRSANAFGEVDQVVEPGNITTTYSYDTRGNLTSVSQIGRPGTTPAGFTTPEVSKQRLFKYDALSRLTNSCNPETIPSSQTCDGSHWSSLYSYDAVGNLLHKNDANGTQIDYTYDALNRVLTKHSPTDPNTNAYFTYDAGANGIGRLWAEGIPLTAGTAFAYDAMGRVTDTAWFDYKAQTGPLAFTSIQYDLAGNMTHLTYPDQRSVSQEWDSAGRLKKVTDTTYGGSGEFYFQPTDGVAQYAPSGALTAATLGQHITESLTLNSRLQPCHASANSLLLPVVAGSGNIYDRQMAYTASPTGVCGTDAGNNGNIYSILDNRTLESQNFTYDPLNRLKTAYTINAPTGLQYNHQYNYDSFGNMLLHDNLSANLGYSIDSSTNRMMLGTAGMQYNADGTLQSDPHHSFSYTAEGFLSCIDGCNTGRYIYNSMGQRTAALHNSLGTWNEYVYLNGQPMADLDDKGTWTDTIYADGQKIARVSSQKAAWHLHGSQAGSCVPLFQATVHSLANQNVQAGDTLVADVKLGTSTSLLLGLFTGGTWTIGETDEVSGQYMFGYTQPDGAWHHVRVNISSYASMPIVSILTSALGWSPGMAWDAWITNAGLLHADGSFTAVGFRDASNVLSGNQCSGDNTTFAMEMADTHDPQAGASYFLDDHLGTTQIELSAGGWPVWQGHFTPFGQEIVNGYIPNDIEPPQADGTSNRFKFTGKERDAESGLDYFGARYYASSMGRWMSPDWADKPEAVPYSSLDNPQSLNLYGYVGNNPLSKVDADGHDPITIGFLGFEVGTGVVEGLAAAGHAVVTFFAAAAVASNAGSSTAAQLSCLACAAAPPLQSTAKATAAPAAGDKANTGPKAEAAPGVTAGGQATDKYGNKIGASGKPQVNEVDHSGKKDAKDAARNEGKGKPEQHASPKKGDPHYHPTDENGNKQPTSTHHNYPE